MSGRGGEGSGGQGFTAQGVLALNVHYIGGDTHCDHDRVPGGRENVRVIIALVVLGELLSEELTGELGAEERKLKPEAGCGPSSPRRQPSPPAIASHSLWEGEGARVSHSRPWAWPPDPPEWLTWAGPSTSPRPVLPPLSTLALM
jgi:hypothetical protein